MDIHEAVATDLLPPVPRFADDGYDWMERLRSTGWLPIASGIDGRLIGEWPYQVVAHYSDHERELYGIAVYTEGDVSVRGYRTRAERDKDTDEYLEETD